MAQKKEYKGNPTWLKWAVTLFIGFVLYNQYVDRKAQKDDSVLNVSQDKPLENQAFAKADMGKYALPSGIIVGGDVAGSGDVASCGQVATVTYSASLPNGTVLQSEAGDKIHIPVGLEDAEKPWVAAVTGMQSGGVRQVQVLASVRYDEKKRTEMALKESDVLAYKVELEALTPSSPSEVIGFQATDRVVGSGNVANCGMMAEVHVRLFAMDGKPYYDSRSRTDAKPLTVHLGKAEYFYGLDRGLLGMTQGGQRTLIIPPEFAIAGGAENNPFKDVLPAKSMVIAEVELLDVRWK
jgi:FKBP-type peptidyl-prolyl cis-trans isomerase FkpA